MKRVLPFLVSFLTLTMLSNAQVAGNGLSFDGSDDHVECPLPAIFNSIGTSEFTIELWANPTLGTFQRLFFAQLDNSNFAVISINSTGEVVFYLNENGINHSVQSSSVLNSLEWVHIAAVWNSSTQEAKIFVNGNETPYETGVFVSPTGTDNKMTIGSRTDGSQPFLGEIDELAIWSYAKSECEVSFEMKDKKNGLEPNLEAYYMFDAGIANDQNPGVDDLQDETLNGYDGTLLNFALAGSSSNWIASNVDIVRFWGDQSPVFVGQLGLVSTISGEQFQWIYCDDLTPVPGAVNLTFDPPSEDPNYTGLNDFYAVVSIKGNCVDTSGCVNVEGTSLSAAEINLESSISVYPNPSNSLVSIKSELSIDRVEIRNVAGQLIEVLSPNSSGIIQLELAKENGIYLVTIHTKAGVLTKKILVQN